MVNKRYNFLLKFKLIIMKTFVRLITLTIIMGISLHANSQKTEKVTIYMKNGDILKGTIEYINETNKVRLNSDCGNSYMLDRTDIQDIKEKENKLTNKNKLYGNAQIGTLIGFNRSNFYGIPLNFNISVGYRITNNVSVGLSSGIVILEDSYLPMAAEFQYDFNKRPLSKKSHFFRLKAGMPLLLNSNSEDYYDTYSYSSSIYPYPEYDNSDISNKKGVFFHPELGVKFSGNENESFYLSLGYLFQTDSYDYDNYYAQKTTKTHVYNRLSLNFGYMF